MKIVVLEIFAFLFVFYFHILILLSLSFHFHVTHPFFFLSIISYVMPKGQPHQQTNFYSLLFLLYIITLFCLLSSLSFSSLGFNFNNVARLIDGYHIVSLVSFMIKRRFALFCVDHFDKQPI